MKSFRCRYRTLLVLLVFAVLGFLALYGLRSEQILVHQPMIGRNLRSDRNLAEDKLVFPQATGEGRKLSVVVVEEHHEVLHHWYKAVDQGVIRRKDNILIHIDGHSDGAPPIFFDTYPSNYFPTKKEHLKTMMQRNDVFILAAAMSGVIKHFIWIWPKWDAENHDSEYEVYPMLLGEVDTWYPELKTRLKSCCMCGGDENGEPIECRFMNITSKSPADEFKIQNPKECKIHTAIKYEELREDVALEMARNGSLFNDIDINDRSHIMLDIDEDFYGCESVIQPVVDDGLTMKIVKRINTIVDTLFCPRTSKMETTIDKFLADLITVFIEYKDCLQKSSKHDKHCKDEFESASKKFSDIIESGAGKKAGICTRKLKSRHVLWKRLIRAFEEMPKQQIQKLKELGFCFRTTPKAFDFGDSEEIVFRICHGANTPNESVVNYHTPASNQEVSERTQLLKSFLQSSEKSIRPSFITVCRSMRDGYTPRKFFHKIENDVLTTVKDAFGVTQIHYDIDLMGGRNGWPERHDGSMKRH